MVEEEARQAIADMGDGAGFILGAGCTARMDTPWENVNAIGRAAIKYGTYRK
jgi:uroporphyrinogen-III decarboxylase